MPKALLHPEHSLNRAWRPRHPLRPHVGRFRRWAMLLLMLLLWSLIGAYVYLTDDARVRRMSADYLATLVGGKVSIGSAKLSIFQGLRLNDVWITVPDGDGPQSTLLEAGTVLIRYDLRALLGGQVVANQITATDLRVNLAEDMRSGQWNYQLLKLSPQISNQPLNQPLTALPEVILRDAQVVYLQLSDGVVRQTGWVAVAGRLGPAAKPQEYEFSLQSRGRQSLGPTIDGSLDIPSSHLSANMRNFVFDPDIQTMLPGPVSKWCRDHRLAGNMNVSVDYSLNSDPAAPDFHVQADLDGVALSLNPDLGDAGLKIHDASGSLVFTKDGLSAEAVTAHVDDNAFAVNGTIGGYSSDAPLDLNLRSIGDVNLPPVWPPVASLPPEARELYRHFHPSGRAKAQIHLTRASAGAALGCAAQVDVVDGAFVLAELPYPISHVTGQLLVGPDPAQGFDTVRVINLHGHGIDGGPNQNAQMIVNGWCGPFDATCGGRIDVHGDNVHADPKLTAALPPQARQALEMFDPSGAGKGPGPEFTAGFDAAAIRDHAGVIPGLRWDVDTDLSITSDNAMYVGFKYPLHEASGKMQLRPGFVNVLGITAKNGAATFAVTGRIDTGHTPTSPFVPDLQVTAKDISIDDTLLAALPAEARQRLKALGAAGKLDVSGKVTGPKMAYDLALTLHDGSLSPDGKLAVSDLTGDLHLTPTRIESADLIGRRGQATILAAGYIDFTGGQRTMALSASATNLDLDDSLHDLLPVQARQPWDFLHPSGAVDAKLDYHTADAPDGLNIAIRPRNLSAAPALARGAAPLKLDLITGSIDIAADQQARWDISGSHGTGTINVAGTWKLNDPAAPWDLHLSGKGLTVDADWVKSMPSGLGKVMQLLQLRGIVGFDCPTLAYRPGAGTFGGDASEPVGEPDADFAFTVTCEKGSLNIGVPCDQLNGSAAIAGTIRAGELRQLQGTIAASALRLAGRPASNLEATLSKPANQPTLHVTGLKATVADGDVAGDLAVSLPDQKSGRYAINMVLNDADVGELTGDLNTKLSGRLSASLQMAGSTSDVSDRQGRGDVRVAGAQMYQLPLLLGLFQVTNLALPISSPFERAEARYNVQGQRVTLEKIQLSSKDMAMQGGGHIDFGAKQVDLTFDTATPTWLSIPLVGPMWQKAENELMQIHVKGSILSPKISASSLDTVTTTVDQVIKGDSGK
ncbi:MAG: hypothetical protein ABSH22_08555 [Tepidisphaeraceae bacterium]